MQRHIRVVAYDPAWKKDFEAESQRISLALENNVVLLHHIGSTSIPGILAKPIIDLLLEVKDIANLDESGPAMEELGYEVMGEFGIATRRYFRKNNAAGIRTHQVHAYKAGNPEIERHLAFRDYMVAHPKEAKAYGNLKQKLAQEHPHDIQAYMDAKDPFIKEHQAKAIAWRSSQTEK